MSANDLLIWMSARERGSWSQFRSAVEQFRVEMDEVGDNDENGNNSTTGDLPVYQAVRFALQRLGHVEFFTKSAGADWRVVPPSLAVHEENNTRVGVLCGARSPGLLDKLGRLDAPVSCESQPGPAMPDRLLLRANVGEVLMQVASDSGLTSQIDAPASLLAALPPVDDPRSRFPAEPPAGAGWTVERFSASKLGWEATSTRELNRMSIALFRFRMKYQRFHYMHWRGRTYRVAVQVGKYAVLRHRRVHGIVQYNEQKRLLSFPLSCRPPLLIERALILCTGLLPPILKDSGRIEYAGVPSKIARLAARLLRQEIPIS